MHISQILEKLDGLLNVGSQSPTYVFVCEYACVCVYVCVCRVGGGDSGDHPLGPQHTPRLSGSTAALYLCNPPTRPLDDST